MDWFLSTVRVAGASFPVAASMVQLQAEVDRAEFDRRLRALEDPVSVLHGDVPALSERLYRALVRGQPGATTVELSDDEYHRYRHALAILEAEGIVKGSHSLTKRFFNGLRVSDPTYRLYLYAMFGDPAAIAKIRDQIEGLERGAHLNGKTLCEREGVPLAVVDALFEVYEKKGYGIRSRSIGVSQYLAKV